MDILNKILRWMDDVCKEEEFDQKLLSRDSPEKEIQEKYLRMFSSQRNKMPVHIFEDNGNKKYSTKEEKGGNERNTEICFKEAFREFLKDIQRNYSEDIWKIKNCLKSK